MKKIQCGLCVLLLLFASLLCLAACGEEPTAEKVMFTVTFDTGGGSPIEPMLVEDGATLLPPSDPVRESYIFDGWVTESGEKWIFETHYVRSNMTLVASWRSAKSVYDYKIVDNKEVCLTRIKQTSPTLVVPDSIEGFPVRAIGEGVFANLSSENVQSIVLPESVTNIGNGAFAGCVDIEILIKGNLVVIGEQAFKNCNRLSEVSFGEGLTKIGNEAFFGCGLTEIAFPQSLNEIREDAFSYCEALRTVVLYGTASDGELVVEDSAFRDSGLTTVFFFGNEDLRDALLLRVAHGNAKLTSATFYYYSESEPTQSGNYWYLRQGKPRIW